MNVDKSEEQSYKVVKANELIQRARFELDTQEQKIVLYLISKIKPDDEEFKWYGFKIAEFRETLNLKGYAGGSYYEYIKELIKKLADKSAWWTDPENEKKKTLVRWISKARINEKNDTLEIRLDEDLKPFLLQLKEHFTQYELWCVLRMRSQFSIRLYELLKSHLHKKDKYVKSFQLDDLRKKMSAENFPRYVDFKRRALEKAIREINDYSDLEVSYEAEMVKKSCKAITITVKVKDVMERVRISNEFFNGAQLDMFPLFPELKDDWDDITDEND